MKIAILNTLYYPYKIGGAEVSVQLLAESLADSGHDVSVITLHEQGHSTIESLNGVTVHRLPVRNLYWPFAKQRSAPAARLLWHIIDIYNPVARADVSRLLKQIKPDLVHTNNLAGFSVAAWDAAKALGIPVAHTTRDYYLVHPNSTLYAANRNQSPRSLACQLFSFIKKWRSQHVDHYVAISRHVQAMHDQLGYFNNRSAEVIYNSVSQPDVPQRRKKPYGNIRLGFMGRLEPAKGIETALQVLRKLGAGYSLHIAGAGASAYIATLQSHSADLDITWLGHTKPEDFFPTIDMLLVPSRWAEPLGRVVLEANSYGVPVVGARSGGIPEIIQQGQTGYACDCSDINEFLSAIRQLADQDRKETEKTCLAWAGQFSRERINARYIQAYQRLTM